MVTPPPYIYIYICVGRSFFSWRVLPCRNGHGGESCLGPTQLPFCVSLCICVVSRGRTQRRPKRWFIYRNLFRRPFIGFYIYIHRPNWQCHVCPSDIIDTLLLCVEHVYIVYAYRLQSGSVQRSNLHYLAHRVYHTTADGHVLLIHTGAILLIAMGRTTTS
jgi:hypothetical protein